MSTLRPRTTDKPTDPKRMEEKPSSGETRELLSALYSQYGGGISWQFPPPPPHTLSIHFNLITLRICRMSVLD